MRLFSSGKFCLLVVLFLFLICPILCSAQISNGNSSLSCCHHEKPASEKSSHEGPSCIENLVLGNNNHVLSFDLPDRVFLSDLLNSSLDPISKFSVNLSWTRIYWNDTGPPNIYQTLPHHNHAPPRA